MKNKKIVALIVLGSAFAVFLITFFLQNSTKNKLPRDYPEIAEKGTLRIVTDYNSVGYFVSRDTISGFNNDLIKLLEKKTLLKIEVSLESSLTKSIEGLKTGDYDVVIRNIPVTSEQKTFLNFTDPVAQNKQVLVQRKKEYNDDIKPIRSHLDLAKKTLFLPQNSAAILRIKNLSLEIGDTIYYKEDPTYEAEQLAMMVAAKEIDYAVCDEKIARKVAESIPELDVNTFIGFTQFEAWAVRYESPILLDSLNSWIKQMKKTREYDKIYKKYYN